MQITTGTISAIVPIPSASSSFCKYWLENRDTKVIEGIFVSIVRVVLCYFTICWRYGPKIGARWHCEFDEPIDGAVYAAAIYLGFAMVENIICVNSLGLTVAF